MGQSRFFEGFLIGAIFGAVIAYLFGDSIKECTEEKIESVKDAVKLNNESPEEKVEKTLGAIEKGFDRITKVLEEKKKTNKG